VKQNKHTKKWILPEKIPVDQLELYNQNGFTNLEAMILHNRKVVTQEDLDLFIDGTLSNIPSFEKLYDSQRAAKIIVEAAKSDKKIFVHGDFDADGICGTALLWDFLYHDLARVLKKNVDVTPYIPDRISQGYGLTPSSIEEMLDNGAELIITNDCGIRDRELIEKYQKSTGVEFIITDHHQPPDDFPKESHYPVVHQMYPRHEYPYQTICGAAVILLLIQAIKKNIGVKSDFTGETPGLDLVALATVTDIMPLKGVNRIFVKYGLKQINSGRRIGLKILAETAGAKLGAIDSYHLGFVLGPRINAAGRIGSAMDAVRLLLTHDKKIAEQYAAKLQGLNAKRQKLTNTILNNCKKEIEHQSLDDKLLFPVGDGWPEGIIGLVAGKLQEQYSKPVLIATKNNGEIRGSARSIAGFNITNAIEKFSDSLDRYGGHEQAAGFTVKKDLLNKFRKDIINFANTEISEEMLIPAFSIDGILSEEELDLDLASRLEQFCPYGYGNRKPVIMIPEVVIVEKCPLGKQRTEDGLPMHMKLVLKGSNLGTFEAIKFNASRDYEQLSIDSIIDIAGVVGINEWNGYTKVQFQMKEWRRLR